MTKDINNKLDDIKKSLGKEKVKEIPNSQKVDRRKFNKRDPKSGRKTKQETLTRTGIKSWVETHINGEIEMHVLDKKTGKEILVKKPRVVAILEKLYQISMKGEGSHEAIGKWLDRALGKPVNIIKGDENEPIVVRIDF